MKKYLQILLFSAGMPAFAQSITFADTNFKNLLVNTICVSTTTDFSVPSDADFNDNGEIEYDEAAAVKMLVFDSAAIADMDGIQYFSNLVTLSCSNSQIENLPVMGLEFLDNIACNGNLFSSLSLCGTAARVINTSDCPNLTYLSIKNNVISPQNLGRQSTHNPGIPPPLPSVWFYNCPLLSTVCYDPGEEPALSYANDLTGVTLVTDCNANCALTTNENRLVDILIVPNPAKNAITVQTADNSRISAITIFDLMGRAIRSVSGIAPLQTVDVSGLQSGTYFVTVSSDFGQQTKKLVKM